jgi:hypothetical protein
MGGRIALKESTIYLGDNGRAFCGHARCAGATAYYSGRDLSGAPVFPLEHPDDIRHALEFKIVCERCGKAPSLIVTP